MSKETPENNQVSSALDFKQRREARDKGEIINLSSGLSVLVRRPEITKLIAQGKIPTTIVMGFMELEKKAGKNLSAGDLETLLGYQREIAKNAVVEPKLVDEPNYDNNEISLDDLEEDDLNEIVQYVNGGAEALELFRRERSSGVSAGLDGEKVSE